jgi:hypothetical protein
MKTYGNAALFSGMELLKTETNRVGSNVLFPSQVDEIFDIFATELYEMFLFPSATVLFRLDARDHVTTRDQSRYFASSQLRLGCDWDPWSAHPD